MQNITSSDNNYNISNKELSSLMYSEMFIQIFCTGFVLSNIGIYLYNNINIPKIKLVSRILAKSMYISAMQKINKTVLKLGKNVYEVSYTINGKLYKMLVSPNRGPSQILMVCDENNNNITELVIPYMGPNYDWHGNNITPGFFGCKELTFSLYNGTDYTYTLDEQLNSKM